MPDTSNRKSVAIVTSIAFSLYNFRGPLIRKLVSQGHRVYALAPDYDDSSHRAVAELGAHPIDIRLDRTGMHPVKDALACMRLFQTLRRLQPDVVLSYFIKPVIYGTLAAKLAQVPRRVALVEGLGYVFTDEDTPAPVRKRVIRWLVLRLYRMAFQASHSVLVLNRDDLNDLTDAGRVDPNKAMVLGGIGVDLDKFAPTPIPSDRICFLLMARLLREKGIEQFAAAARCVKALHPQVHFVLLGGFDPNPGGLTRAEVSAWVEEGILEWPDHVEDVRSWITRSSVYVLPSYYREGVPRSTQEAMAMGRPVITTNSIGCRETVEDGVNGFLVPVRDGHALAQTMLRFIDEPELIEKMGRESRRLAEERFDVHRVNAAITEAMGIH